MATGPVDDWETVQTGGGRGSDWETVTTPEQSQSALSQAGSFLKGTVKGVAESLNPVNLYQGLRHPVEPMLAELRKAQEAYQQGNTAEALARIATGVFPVLGPLAGSIAEAPGKIIYGETPEKRGEAFGQVAAIPIGGKLIPGAIKVAGEALSKAAPPLYQSALNLSTKIPLPKRAERVAAGLEENVPVSKGGLVKSQQLIDDLNTKIDAKIAAYEANSLGPGNMVSRDVVAGTTEQLKPAFNTVTRAQDIQSVNAIKDQFVADRPPFISPSESQTIKKSTYKQLGERAYGERKGPGPEAEKALARGFKEELESMIPELKGLNSDEAVMIGLNKSIDQAVRSRRYELSGPLTGLPVLTMLKSVIQHPVVKSRLALALNQARSKAAAVAPVGEAINPALYPEQQQP